MLWDLCLTRSIHWAGQAVLLKEPWCMHHRCMALASKVAVNTTLAAAAGGLTSLACEALLGHPGDIGPILNGILSGAPLLKGGTCMRAGHVAARYW